MFGRSSGDLLCYSLFARHSSGSRAGNGLVGPIAQYDRGLIGPPLVLVSGWSDNGWLSGGHAVRMAMELCKPNTGSLAR